MLCGLASNILEPCVCAQEDASGAYVGRCGDQETNICKSIGTRGSCGHHLLLLATVELLCLLFFDPDRLPHRSSLSRNTETTPMWIKMSVVARSPGARFLETRRGIIKACGTKMLSAQALQQIQPCGDLEL